jgi:hypothetical protein
MATKGSNGGANFKDVNINIHRAINAVASALLYYSKCKYDICRNKEYI